jgi:glycosyltransferase involved in cell wall biosynthesis
MKSKKVLVLHSSSDLYGASNSLLRSLMAFQRIGIEPTLLLSEKGPLNEKVEALGIPVVILRLGVIRRKYFNLLGLINRKYFIFISTIKICQLIRKENFELVLTNTTVVFSGALAAKLTRTKHIWHVRETITTPFLFKKFITLLLNTTGTVNFFVSKASRDNYLPQLDMEKAKVIYNGIDSPKFVDNHYDLKKEIGLESNTVVISMVARVNLLKGQKYFLEIANILLQSNKNLHFVLVGDTFPGYEYLHTELKEFISSNNLDENVTDLNFRSDIQNIMSGSDIFVLPSIQYDSLPTTVLEAMSASKPVIATGLGGSLEMLVNQETGFLIPHDNAKVAAEAIQKLIDNPTLRLAMGRRGRERVVEKFSLDLYMEKFGKLIKEIIGSS